MIWILSQALLTASIPGKPSGLAWALLFAAALLVSGFVTWTGAMLVSNRRWRRSGKTQANGAELSSITETAPNILALIARKSTAVRLTGKALVFALIFASVIGAGVDHFYFRRQDRAAWKSIIQDYHESYAAWLARQPKTENNR